MRRSRGDRTPMYAEVNVVSLIDVMMLMMVIFMITAPIMQGGVDLALPRADARAVESRTGVTISVLRSGQIYVDDLRVSLREFRAQVRTLVGRSRDAGVYLRVDRSAPWEAAVQVLAILNNAGITNVAIVAEAEDVVR